MKKLSLRRLFYIFNNWCVFFLLAAFVVTCCMTLFITVLSDTLEIVFTEENIAKGTSTLKLSDFEFNVDNSTGKIFTFKSTPKEKFKELLEECNNTLKEILNNFNSENVAKNKTGLRGLIA